MDQRSDLFSFGAVLYEMLTGRKAFKGTTPADTLSAILREDPTDSLDGGALPGGLLRVVRRCLEKAPEDRFQTARDLGFALEGASTEPKVAAGESTGPARRRRLPRLVLGGALVLGAAGLGFLLARGLAPRAAPASFQRLTFRIGNVAGAKFAPDGETILYSARWGQGPLELFSTRASARGSRSLGLADALIRAVSSREEMAILLRPQQRTFSAFEGTLARAPMAGGTPRELLEGVLDADWSPDGKDLAVIHVVGERHRLEYPIGNVLYEPDPPAWISELRVSPSGDLIAFIENPVPNDNRGGLFVIGKDGPKRSLASGFVGLNGLSWSPGGDEVWFTASRVGPPQQVHAVSLSGRERVILETLGQIGLEDVSKRGQALVTRGGASTEVRARARGAAEEAELPAADLSFLSDLSDDGTLVLGTDVGEGGPNFSFYTQKTDGSPPVWLGEGDGQALSSDSRFVLAVLLHTQPQQLVIAPTGAGEMRTLQPGDVVRYPRAVWDNTGRRVVFTGVDKNDVERLYLQDAAGGAPRAITGEGVSLRKIGRPVSPDGRWVAAVTPDGLPALYPLAGGEPVSLPGVGELDVPICWTADGRELFVARYEVTPPRIERVEVASGRIRSWTGLGRSAPSGLVGEYRILVAPDGASYAYNYVRALNDLYLTSLLK